MILLDEYRPLAAHPKLPSRSGVVKKRATSPHKNRVWNFLKTLSGRMSSDALQVVEIAPGSVTFTYRSASGRAEWLSRDPLGESDGPNVYSYVGNNPSNLVDPNGLWGVQFGDINIGVGDPNAIFTNDSWGDAARGGLAFADGVVPFADPFADNGFYDPCDSDLGISRAIGEITRDLNATLAGGGLLTRSKVFANSSTFGKTGSLFGKSKGLLNNNDYARVGWSYKKGTGDVFRAVVGGRKTPVGKAISDKVPAGLRHLDF